MDLLAPALTVLSAMIAPVVIISAIASLIISTSNRGVRATDRLHDWSAEFAALAALDEQTQSTRERRTMIFDQLDQLTSQARLLQRSLASCYVSLGLFVTTSVAIAVVALAGMLGLEWRSLAALPVVLSLLGAGALFYCCVLLVAEARRALRATDEEMDYLWQQGMRNAPEELLERFRARRRSGLGRLEPRLLAAVLRELEWHAAPPQPEGDAR
jgi:hypothetical protein